MGEGQDEKPGVILQLLRGEGAQGAPDFERKTPADDEVVPIIVLDGEIKELQFQMGRVETDLLRMAERKFELYRQVIAKQEQQMSMAKKLAAKLGIDPEDQTHPWTLDLTQKMFVRRK